MAKPFPLPAAIALIAPLALGIADPLCAQESLPTSQLPSPPLPATPGDTESYPRGFFDRFYPQTALDLLERGPGFSLQEGAELRGFAGGPAMS